jgi:hypothetical protein
MKKVFPLLLLAAACFGGYSYYRNHLSLTKAQAAEAPQETAPEPKPDVQDPNHLVTMVSPIEQLLNQNGGPAAKEEPKRPWKPTASDYIKESPVGTSSAIVNKTFAVTSPAKFAFQVPPHATNPQLVGSYRSFVKTSGVQSSDGDADVDLLLMTDQQYGDFLQGNSADVVYSVDSSHEQDVSFGLPATMDRPVQYYLVFRNSSRGAGKKVVQADFRVDF